MTGVRRVGPVRAAPLLASLCIALAAITGCSRAHFRQAADSDAYHIIQEKATGVRWAVPREFQIDPEPRSRLFDSTPIDDPLLPPPHPRLYAYELPSVSTATAPSEIRLVTAGGERLDAAAANNAQAPDRAARAAAPPQTRPDVTLIPNSIWESLPAACLRRMFEFASVRDEYVRSYEIDPPSHYRDPARQLTLEDIVELTLLNSREYQAQKEALYSAALRLSLERFAFDLKFSSFGGRFGPSGNGTAIDAAQIHGPGESLNTLRVPSSVQGDQVLATGGDLLARLANDVVLTFNGPDGFAADVSSELFFSLSQTVFQRDIRFERLTQAERDVVYAARDFARFRKTLFFQLVVQYYNLLQTYRQIEIDSQNYFTLVRAFNQRAVETRTGLAPRVQLDQVEQDALRGRSGLVATCNRLERELDNLKIRMGLPPELPVNLDLEELEELTLRDELEVAQELVRRARRQLHSARDLDDAPKSAVLNAAVALVDRMLDAELIRERLGRAVLELKALQELQLRVRAAEANLDADLARHALRQDRTTEPPLEPARILERTLDLIDALHSLALAKLDLAQHRSAEPQATTELQRNILVSRAASEQIRGESQAALAELQLDRIPLLLRRADTLVDDAETLDRTAAQLAQIQHPEPLRTGVDNDLQRILDDSQRQLDEDGGGLVPVRIEPDDAMLTALVLRLDLMNERGAVADQWRGIKLRADELRSVLNFNFSQRVAHRGTHGTSADDDFVENETRLSAALDTPFHRRAQRNNFRQALINYQAALRNLTLLEDTIKLAVRNDLRDLSVAIEQYQIDIASAALARERVNSTQLQLALGVANVTARDFLEAQDAYSESLSRVASRHIGYILNRTQLFLNLELLDVDERGFWSKLYDERHQPYPALAFPADALPPYGSLPNRVHYSEPVRRMLDAGSE